MRFDFPIDLKSRVSSINSPPWLLFALFRQACINSPFVRHLVIAAGGPLSPIKSTLATSLGHRLLDDIAKRNEGTLNLQTRSQLEKVESGPSELRARLLYNGRPLTETWLYQWADVS